MKKLSYGKFEKLIHDRGSTIHSIWVWKGSVIFLEVESPSFKRKFFIYVPDKYKLPCPKNGSVKIINIRISSNVEECHQDYWSLIKGPVMEKTLLCVASEKITLFQSSGVITTFSLGKDIEEAFEEEEEVPKHTKKNDAELLLDEINQFEQTIDVDSDVELPQMVDNPISIIFENDKGEEMEMEEIYNLPKVVVTTQPEVEIEEEEEEEESQEKIEEYEERTKAELKLGLFYLVVDIHSFYTGQNPEDNIESFYKELDNEESSIRKQRLSELETSVSDLILIIKNKYSQIEQEEKDAEKAIETLHPVYTKACEIAIRVKDSPEKLKRAEELKDKTSGAISDARIKILKLRDKTDSLLTDYGSYLQDLLSIG